MNALFNFISNEIAEGLMKNLTYNRLVLSNENFKKTRISAINVHGVMCTIVQGHDDKNYLMDMSKLVGKIQPLKVHLAVFKSQGVIKEIDIPENCFL